MVYLEKNEVNEEAVSYFYYLYKGTKKGVLTYFPKTDICRIEEFCEEDGEDSCYESHRNHAFVRMIKYYREKKYPEKDMVAWG